MKSDMQLMQSSKMPPEFTNKIMFSTEIMDVTILIWIELELSIIETRQRKNEKDPFKIYFRILPS